MVLKSTKFTSGLVFVYVFVCQKFAHSQLPFWVRWLWAWVAIAVREREGHRCGENSLLLSKGSVKKQWMDPALLCVCEGGQRHAVG
jgi:hypothetical protein